MTNYTWGLSSTDINTCSVACESGTAYVGLHDEDCFCLDFSASTFAPFKTAHNYPAAACASSYAGSSEYVAVHPSSIAFNGNICDTDEDGYLLGPSGCESNCFDVGQIADTSVPYTLTLPSTTDYVTAPLACQYACGEREVYQYFGLTGDTNECYCLGEVGAGPVGTTKYKVAEFGTPVAFELCDGKAGFGSESGAYISLYATDYKFV